MFPTRVLDIVGSSALTGIIMGSAPVLTLILRKHISEYIQRYGSKIFIITGILITFLGTGWFLTADNFWALLAARTIQGSGLIVFFFSSLSMVTYMIPAHKRGQLYGIYTIIFIFPLLFSPLVGTYIVNNFTFVHLIGISLACLTAGFLLVLNLREKDMTRPGSKNENTSLTSLLKNKKAAISFLLVFIIITGDAGILTFLPIAAEKHSLENFSLYFTFFAGSTIFIRFTLGKYFDRFARQKVILTGLFFIVAGLALISRVSFKFLITGSVIYGAGYGITDSNLLPYILKILKNKPNETIVAVYSISFDCGYLFGPFFLGAVAEKTSYPVLFLMMSGSIFLTGLIFMFITKKSHNDILR